MIETLYFDGDDVVILNQAELPERISYERCTTVEQVADAISSLLSDTAQAQRMGKAGTLRAQRLFAKETTARHLRRVLVGGGKVGWHLAWLGDDPLLAGALARQALLRVRLLLGLGKPAAQGLPPG